MASNRKTLFLVLAVFLLPAAIFAGGGREEAPAPDTGIRPQAGAGLEPGARVSAAGILGVYGREPDRFLGLRFAAPPDAGEDAWLMELIVTDRLRATLDRYQGRRIEVEGVLEALPRGRRHGAIRVQLLRSDP